ncbi:putative G-protein coupled receptor F59B2.13 [Tubulanus polymorphus]|uniref:putative G-protein coupled receptor F59B2.13 n=1 Tax=Tubulanus polymorphus TaxID=672921 RepID=UPI003DA26066
MNDSAIGSYGATFYASIVVNAPRVTSPAIRRFQTIFIPVIIVPGVFGNIASFLVMTSRKFRVSSCSQYLAALAVFDTFTLVVYSLPFINQAFYPYSLVTFENSLSCKIYEYLSSINDAASSWMVVILTMERLVIVVWPFAARTVATPAFSRKVILIMSIFWSVSCIYIFIATKFDINLQSCVMTSFWYNIYFSVSPVTIVYIPTVSVLICNALLIILLRRSNGFGQSSGKSASATKATVMVLMVSLLFTVCTLPNTVFAFILPYVSLSPQTVIDISSITSAIYGMNSAINFYVYLLSGDEVRNFVVLRLKCGRIPKSTT